MMFHSRLLIDCIENNNMGEFKMLIHQGVETYNVFYPYEPDPMMLSIHLKRKHFVQYLLSINTLTHRFKHDLFYYF